VRPYGLIELFPSELSHNFASLEFLLSASEVRAMIVNDVIAMPSDSPSNDALGDFVNVSFEGVA